MSLVLTLNQSWVAGAVKEGTSEESAGELRSWGAGELAQLVKPLSCGPEDLSLSSRTHTKCQTGQRVLETRSSGRWEAEMGSPGLTSQSTYLLKVQADERSFLKQKLKGT